MWVIRAPSTFAFGCSHGKSWETRPGGAPSLDVDVQALLLQSPHTEHEVRCKADHREARRGSNGQRDQVTTQTGG